MNLKFFNVPLSLKALGHPRVSRLLQDFATELQAANIPLPTHDPANDEYFCNVATLVASPTFPERPGRILELLEFLATPENIDRLNAEIALRLPSVRLDRTRPAIDRALELWFWSQDGTIQLAVDIEAASNQSCSTTPAPDQQPPVAPKSDEGGSTHPPAFPRLSKRDVLVAIGLEQLDPFFEGFKTELAEKNITPPGRAGDVSTRVANYSRLLLQPELLPQTLVNALLAIEEFASPKNQRLLEKLAADSGIDQSHAPEGWALRLWLRAPFDLQYIKTLSAHIPPNFYDGDIEYVDPEALPAPALVAPQRSTAPDSAPGEDVASLVEINRFPRNKIARLPKEVRESVNRLLGQGLTYAEILQQLGKHAEGLNKSNLSRWKRSPHQAWLRHQERLEESGSRLKFALEAVRQNENNQIHQATQQIAALRISELFTQLDLSTLKEAVTSDPSTLARLAQLLPKLSQGGLECERQRFELSQRKSETAAEKPELPLRRGLSNKALRHVQQKLRLM